MDYKKPNLQEKKYNITNNKYTSDKNNEEIDSVPFNDFKSINLIHNNFLTNSENDNNNSSIIYLSKDKEPLISIESDDVKEEEKEETIEGKKLLGRKRKDSFTEGKHTKYSPDNMNRKIKSILLNSIFIFINLKINKLYKNDPDYDKNKDELKKNEQSQIVNSHISFNQDFLNQTLEHIFSEKISQKYKKYSSDHNKNLIIKLKNDKNKKRGQIFHSIFAKTFLECLEHFRGTKYIDELEGLTTFDIFKVKYEKDPDYLSSLEYKLNVYEDILKNQKGRKKRNM